MNNFSDKAEQQWWHYILLIVVLVLILLTTVSLRLARAIHKNPVEALKHE